MDVPSMEINLRRICRLCLTEKTNMKNLFEHTLAHMVRSCTKLEVYKGDGLPSLVCIQCVNQLSRSFSFKELCEKSDTTLREYIMKENALGNVVNVSPNVGVIDKTILSDYIGVISTTNAEHKDVSTDYTSPVAEVVNLEEADIYKSSDIEKYYCNICSKDFPSYNVLQQHYSIHIKKKSEKVRNFICTVCNKGFYDIKYLNIHMARHFEGKAFPCKQCDEKCSDKSSLKRHTMNVHSNVPKHKCQFCSKSFLFPGGLETHLKSHTNERPYVCELCSAAFTTKKILSNHIKVHGDKPHQCTYCQKLFTYASNLTVHIRTHTGERPYLCSKCGKGFCTSTELTLHLQKHNGEKRKLRETCSVCKKMFATSFDLKKHYRIHTGEKPFSCMICNMRFTAKSGLQRHARVHSEVRNYQCSDCPKAFKDSSTLRSHVRIHSGEKPYACTICDHRFAQSSARNTHMKTHAPS